jgi:hypothetical protein
MCLDVLGRVDVHLSHRVTPEHISFWDEHPIRTFPEIVEALSEGADK